MLIITEHLKPAFFQSNILHIKSAGVVLSHYGTALFPDLKKWKDLKRWNKYGSGKISLSLNTRLVWSLIALFGAGDIVGLKAEGMRFVPHDFLTNLFTVSILVTISIVYTYIRYSPRIAEMTHMAAVFLSFAAVTAMASYLVASWHRPLVDDYLVAADHAMGLDWLASYKWITAHPLIYKVLYFAYYTLIPQIIFLLIFLSFRGRCARSWEMIWLFIVSLTICIAFSALWPAVGAFGYYHVEADRDYVHVFMGLYNGTLRVIGDTRVQGIIQFPSFHVALGILLTYVARDVRILFMFFLALNILLFVSTPVIGGHHFADVWGGVVLALATILVVRKAFAAGLMPDIDKIASM